jgi:hypothetical protein
MPGLPGLVRLAEALGVAVERFAEGMEGPARLDTAPGPTPTKKGRAGRLPGMPETPREQRPKAYPLLKQPGAKAHKRAGQTVPAKVRAIRLVAQYRTVVGEAAQVARGP